MQYVLHARDRYIVSCIGLGIDKPRVSNFYRLSGRNEPIIENRKSVYVTSTNLNNRHIDLNYLSTCIITSAGPTEYLIQL